MKHAVLTSVGHNIADSLGSGIGLMIGVYEMDVFGEAARSAEGFIEVDFLQGTTSGATPSEALGRAIQLYAKALPELCRKHGVCISDYDRLTARYSGTWPAEAIIVEVTDRAGKASRDTYLGRPAARPKSMDSLGRLRRVKSA